MFGFELDDEPNHYMKSKLVGGFNPIEKYHIVKLEIFPIFRGENNI